MNILIETLKENYVNLGKDCEDHYTKIQKALMSGKQNKIDATRKGYSEKWAAYNKMTDFLKANSINFFNNYNNKTIQY